MNSRGQLEDVDGLVPAVVALANGDAMMRMVMTR